MMSIHIKVELEHGVLFLLDPYADRDIPPTELPISYNETCIAFHTPHYIDGYADVTVSDSGPDDKGDPTLVHKINVPNKMISILDSRDFYFFLLPVREEISNVALWMYEESSIKKVWVHVQNLDLF